MKWKTFVFWIGLAEIVGILSGLVSMEGMARFAENITQPPLSPPAVLFPIVWTVLYALMGFGAARIYYSPDRKERSMGLNLFILQLVLNFLWSPLFFNRQAYGAAFILLLLLLGTVLAMSVSFYKADPLAGKLQIPHIIWLSFAAYLNLGVWYLN